jgi:hypothetical protein
MSAGKYDLLAVFDEENDELVFYRRPPKGSAPKRSPLTARPAFTLQLSELRNKGANEAERLVGAGILLFFEYHSKRKIGIRDYEEQASHLAEDTIGRLEKMPAEGLDSEKKFELAMAYYDRGLGRSEWSDIEKAEALLREAASGRLSKARKFLDDHWPRMRASAERKMKG